MKVVNLRIEKKTLYGQCFTKVNPVSCEVKTVCINRKLITSLYGANSVIMFFNFQKSKTGRSRTRLSKLDGLGRNFPKKLRIVNCEKYF